MVGVDKMKKIILKNIFIGSIISLAIMAVMVFGLEVLISRKNAEETAQMRIADAVERLADGKAEIAELTENLDKEYISKTNAFAWMIKYNPSIINNASELEKIRQLLEVDELHVTDENGIIRWGTIPEYFGFDFAKSEQTKPFLPILEDDTLEMAQEAQPSGTVGKWFQYISVPRRDKKGIIQIGMEPVRLENTLANSQPDVILKEMTVGNSGTMFALSKADMTVAALFDRDYVGKAAADIGLEDSDIAKLLKKSAFINICGSTYLAKCTETDDYYVGAIVPLKEVMGEAASTAVIVFILSVAVIALLAVLVNRAVAKHIISGLSRIEEDMQLIKDGNSDIRIDVRSCEEFCILSDDINNMLDSIRSKVKETEMLNQSMTELLKKITDVSKNINAYSDEMQNVSAQISDGSSSQAATIEELSATFASISREVNESAIAANNANQISQNTGLKLKSSSEKMGQLRVAMQHISEVSQKIGKITKAIDDIAFQTNILALNASVEAARAGEHGKGFAVVANEVRELASKSADAVNDTTELIRETIAAVQDGEFIAEDAVNEIDEMISGVEKSAEMILEISEATAHQASAINEAVEGMNQISAIVQNNSGISFSANDTANKLDDEARKLTEMVHEL